MRTYRLIISIAFLLCAAGLHSQDISVNLSIRWENSPYIFNTDSIVSTPRLVVAYKNESNRNLYILKVSSEEHGLPGFPAYVNVNRINADFDDSKSHIHHKNFCGEEFAVLLYFSHSPDPVWFVLPYSLIHEDEIEIDNDVQDEIGYITCFIRKKFYGCWWSPNNSWYYNLSNITETFLASINEKNFFFLRAGETKEDVYDITPFWIVKGIYKFIISNDRFPDNVVVGKKPHATSGVIYQTAKLPESVGDYQLYSGEYKTDTLTVVF